MQLISPKLLKTKAKMTSKLEGICIKFTFNKIKTFEEVIDYKTIYDIHHKIQANASTIQSKLVRRQHGILKLVIQQNMYHTVTRHNFVGLTCPPQAAPVPQNTSADKTPNVDPTPWEQFWTVAPEGQWWIRIEAATPGLNKIKVLQVSIPSVHQLQQPCTIQPNPKPVWWPWDNILHGSGREQS